MKSLLIALTLFITFNVNSSVYRSGTADFSHLNAGVYQVELELVPKDHLVTGIPSTRMRNDDGEMVCETRVNFDIGMAKLTISRGRWSITQNYPVIARIAYDKSSEICDQSILTRQEEVRMFVEVINPAINLPIEGLKAFLTPFRGFFTAKAFIDMDEHKQVVDPKELLDDANIRAHSPQANDLYYYIYTQKNGENQFIESGILPLH